MIFFIVFCLSGWLIHILNSKLKNGQIIKDSKIYWLERRKNTPGKCQHYLFSCANLIRNMAQPTERFGGFIWRKTCVLIQHLYRNGASRKLTNAPELADVGPIYGPGIVFCIISIFISMKWHSSHLSRACAFSFTQPLQSPQPGSTPEWFQPFTP